MTNGSSEIVYPENAQEYYYELTLSRVINVPIVLARDLQKVTTVTHVLQEGSPTFISIDDGIVTVDTSQAEIDVEYTTVVLTTYGSWKCGSIKIIKFRFNECVNPDLLGDF